jgi:hypothetical protein
MVKMYNYCVEPVEVKAQDIEWDGVTNITYPLRVFTDTCKDWCSMELLDSLPSQEGVCDMAIGKACQQLQVDGWIDPRNWENSKLLKFADADGNWTDIGTGADTGTSYKNLTAKRIKNVCGCFLLGAECGDGNCSVTYCGAGTDGNKGPGMVSFGENTDYKPSVKECCGSECDEITDGNQVNRAVCSMKTVYDFDGTGTDSEAKGWTDNIDTTNFSCYDENNIYSRCFEGCNYVNYNDTCWMASPEERKQDLVMSGTSETEGFKNLNTWPCEGNHCDPYQNNYGCFGYCNTDDYKKTNADGSVDYMGRCGTEEWFDHSMNLNPEEKRYKLKKELYKQNNLTTSPNSSMSWPKWQNFYSYTQQNTVTQTPNTEYTVPGWGTYQTDGNGNMEPYGLGISDPDRNLCSFASCADPDSVKPFRNYKTQKNCGSSCSVNLQTNVNNQGVISGGLISTLNGGNACHFESNNLNSERLDKTIAGQYISFMGKNDCTSERNTVGDSSCEGCYEGSNDQDCVTNGCNELMKCVYGSEMCVSVETVGVDTTTQEDILSGDNCNVCSGTKSSTCCISPSVNPHTPGTVSAISWETKNVDILNTVGNRVSYICENSCPNGSVDLQTLEQGCNGVCSERNESSCGDCEYCAWLPMTTESLGRCVAQCPLAPLNNIGGWVETESLVTPIDDLVDQSEIPDDPDEDEESELKSDNTGLIIGLVVLSLLLGIAAFLKFKKRQPVVLKQLQQMFGRK